MGFLRRFAGGNPRRPEWMIPEGEYREVAGVIHHLAEFGHVFERVDEALIEDMSAMLVRDPRNEYDSNAVEVRIRGALAGYPPHEIAAAWSARLAEAEARGMAVRARAHVWHRWAHNAPARHHLLHRHGQRSACRRYLHGNVEPRLVGQGATRERRGSLGRQRHGRLLDRPRRCDRDLVPGDWRPHAGRTCFELLTGAAARAIEGRIFPGEPPTP